MREITCTVRLNIEDEANDDDMRRALDELLNNHDELGELAADEAFDGFDVLLVRCGTDEPDLGRVPRDNGFDRGWEAAASAWRGHMAAVLTNQNTDHATLC